MYVKLLKYSLKRLFLFLSIFLGILLLFSNIQFQSYVSASADIKGVKDKLEYSVSSDKFVKGDGKITNIEKNVKRYLETTPDDTYYANTSINHSVNGQMDSWNLRGIGLNPSDEVPASAWKTNTGSSNTVVAVIDTGIYLTHPDLVSNLWVNSGETAGNGVDDDNNGEIDDVNGFNFADSLDSNSDGDFKDPSDINDANVADINGHGTHVAGIIAGKGNNSEGIAGVCFNCKIMSLKVVNAQGFAYDSDIALAIHYATDMGAKVINMSLGGGGYSESINDATTYAFNNGTLVVAAAGNNGGDASDSYPGAAKYTVSVGALDYTNVRPSFSKSGNRLDISAPGVSILSTKLNTQSANCIVGVNYYCLSGTSMASPHVAGVAALIKDNNPSFTPKDLRAALLNSSTDLGTAGFDTEFGYGKVNAISALTQSALGNDVTPPTVSLTALGSPDVKGTVNFSGSVNDTNIYMYTIRIIQSGSYVVKERSGRGNVSSSTLVSLDTTDISDGNYTVNVVAEDMSGNLTTSNTLSISIDNTPPETFNMTSSPYTTDTTPLLSWQAATDVNSPVKYDVVIDSVTVSSDQLGTSYQILAPYSEGVNHTLSIVAKDPLLNTRTVASTFGVDLTPPVVGSPTNTINSNQVTITYSYSDSFSGISSHQMSLNGGAYQSFTYPYSVTLTDSEYTYSIKVIDNAQNFTTISGSFTIDSRKSFLTTKADFNTDSKVDLSDLSILATNWNLDNNNADANGDGKTDLSDLSILATNWNQSY